MHLLRQGVKSSMYASQWFLTLFGSVHVSLRWLRKQCTGADIEFVLKVSIPT